MILRFSISGTSTAEPTASGIIWTYIKEMEQYNALWEKEQKIIFDLGNIVNDICESAIRPVVLLLGTTLKSLDLSRLLGCLLICIHPKKEMLTPR